MQPLVRLTIALAITTALLTVTGWSAAQAQYDIAGSTVEPVTPAAAIATSVSGGNNHTCAVTEAGGVMCWGFNESSQLGAGYPYASRTQNTPIEALPATHDVEAVAAGGSHTCALKSDGTVICWGGNGSGQIGNGTTNWNEPPVNVQGLGGTVDAITAGGEHTCAITNEGAAKCWGSDQRDQLGNGTLNYQTVPIGVSGLDSGVRDIAAGESHTCALLQAGSVKCWGSGYGLGTWPDVETPVEIAGLAGGVLQISAGGSHTCGLMASGGVKCWGSNYNGQLGNNSTTESAEAVSVVGLDSGVARVTSGGDHACALLNDGTVRCWGRNNTGQLGDGTITDRKTPVTVQSLRGTIDVITAGGGHTCAALNDGSVQCWGDHTLAQLGAIQSPETGCPGNAGSWPCSLEPTDTAAFGPTAELTIQKTVIGQSPDTDWLFQLWNGTNSYTVTLPATGGSQLLALRPGQYGIVEGEGPYGGQKPGYTNEHSCDVEVIDSYFSLSVPLMPGLGATCTFTSTAEPARLDITKIVVGDVPEMDWHFTGSPGLMDFDLPSVGGSTAFTVPAGTYTITEQLHDYYAQEISCNDGTSIAGNSVAVALAPGGQRSCTFVNSLKPASLTITKTVVGATSGNDWRFTASEGIGDFLLPDIGGSRTFTLTSGIYTVTEVAQSGYMADVACSDGSPAVGATLTVTLKPNSNVGCTFTNTAVTTVVEGIVYLDANGNGVPDSIETLIGAVVTLQDGTQAASGRDMPFEQSDVTDADGRYRFESVPLGEYTLAVHISSEMEAIYTQRLQVLPGITTSVEPIDVSGTEQTLYLPTVRQ